LHLGWRIGDVLRHGDLSNVSGSEDEWRLVPIATRSQRGRRDWCPNPRPPGAYVDGTLNALPLQSIILRFRRAGHLFMRFTHGEVGKRRRNTFSSLM
jgi:hypothetical protein